MISSRSSRTSISTSGTSSASAPTRSAPSITRARITRACCGWPKASRVITRTSCRAAPGGPAARKPRLRWVAEGGPGYYGSILSRRAGVIGDKEYLTTIAGAIRGLQNTPGRLEQSIEEASFDAWIKYYRPDENTLNSAISYYDKGAIVGLLLDLEIRRRSSGAKSLDDVMRYLYNEFGKKNRNYTPEDFQRAAEQMAGASLDDFFRRFVRGREELDYTTAFSAVGLQLLTTAPST